MLGNVEKYFLEKQNVYKTEAKLVQTPKDIVGQWICAETSRMVEPSAGKDHKCLGLYITFHTWINTDGGSKFIWRLSTFCSLNGA